MSWTKCAPPARRARSAIRGCGRGGKPRLNCWACCCCGRCPGPSACTVPCAPAAGTAKSARLMNRLLRLHLPHERHPAPVRAPRASSELRLSRRLPGARRSLVRSGPRRTVGAGRPERCGQVHAADALQWLAPEPPARPCRERLGDDHRQRRSVVARAVWRAFGGTWRFCFRIRTINCSAPRWPRMSPSVR